MWGPCTTVSPRTGIELHRLEALGVPTEFHVCESLGTGTVAEGWIEDARRSGRHRCDRLLIAAS